MDPANSISGFLDEVNEDALLVEQATYEFGGSIQAVKLSDGLLLTDAVPGNYVAGVFPSPFECEYGCLKFAEDPTQNYYLSYEGGSPFNKYHFKQFQSES